MKSDRPAIELPESALPTRTHGLSGFVARLRSAWRPSAREEQTQRALERFRLALEISSDGIFLCDRATMRFVDCNEAACRLTGLTREQMLRCGPQDIVDVDRARIEAHYDMLIAQTPHSAIGEEPLRGDRGPGGLPRFLESNRCAVLSGDQWLIVTSARDVTARRRQQQLLALEHSVTRCLAEGGRSLEVMERVLRAICESEHLEAGGYYSATSNESPLRLLAGFRFDRADRALSYLSRKARDGVENSSIVALVRTEGKALWMPHAKLPCSEDAIHPEGLVRTQFGFPVRVNGQVIGVMSFLTGAMPEPDERLLQAVSVIGDQVGQFLQRRLAERRSMKNEQRFRSLADLSTDWYWEQDSLLRFTTVGGGWDASGKQRPAFAPTGVAFGDLPNLLDGSGNAGQLRSLMQKRERFIEFEIALDQGEGRVLWLSLSGDPVIDADGHFHGYRGVARDVTERHQAEERIHHLATHDALTGLPNRVMFSNVLNQSIEHARRSDDRFALMFIDLDRFKVVNDTLGHDAGDELLKVMGRRLSQCVRSTDVFARLGGDEFVVLLRHVGEENEIAAVARKILDTANEPVELGDQECRVSASIGVCRYPGDAQDEQSLMKGADIAMYLAKQEGKNNFQFYSPDARTLDRLRLETHLRHAIDRKELQLHYQPKIDLASGSICGFEALLRWNSAELGFVSPVDFIPVAEETGLILPIGRWVLATACAQAVEWMNLGMPPAVMAVNLSARQFSDEHLIDEINAVLRDTGMPAHLLELEITESMVAHGADHAVEILNAIKAMGVRLAIDDFGTGYSSLAQLKRFPIDSLKVDRSFIRDIPGDRDDMAITQAIIAMGKTLRLTIVAEGVETPEQRAFLREHGCDEMQGYLFSRPLPPAQLLDKWRQHAADETVAMPL